MNGVWAQSIPIATSEDKLVTLFAPAVTPEVTSWTGVSRLLVEAPVGNLDNFALTPLNAALNTTLVLAIRWPLTASTAARYKLWEDVGEVLLFPKYTGQLIGPSAVLELWSVENETPALDDTLLQTTYIIQGNDCGFWCGGITNDASIALGWTTPTCSSLATPCAVNCVID